MHPFLCPLSIPVSTHPFIHVSPSSSHPPPVPPSVTCPFIHPSPHPSSHPLSIPVSTYPFINLSPHHPLILHSFLPPPSVTRPHILPFCHQSSHLFFPIHSPVLPSHPCIPTFSHPPPHSPSALPSTRPPVTRAVFPGTVVTSCLCRSSLLQTILEIWCNLWLGTCSEAPSLSLSERPERSGLCFLSLRVAGLRGLLFLLTAIGSLC